VESKRAKPLVLLNPPPAEMGGTNAIVWGRARQYYVAEFPGPLSIKTVVRGSAMWQTREAERLVDSGGYLVLNAGRAYSLTVDARETVETFCLFFRNGSVEDALRVESSDPEQLLDAPFAGAQASSSGNGETRVEFFEALHRHDRVVSPHVRAMYARVKEGKATQAWLEDQFFAVAKALQSVRLNSHRQARRIPAKKLSTKIELYRRLLRGRDYLDSFSGGETRLDRVASEACLSPYHFHRLFREVFGETPNKYLQRRRLANARQLLRSTDRTITEICLEIGFDSMTSFSALFRRIYGCSPRKYRFSLQK
jgi:AraC family transcriptional regulator